MVIVTVTGIRSPAGMCSFNGVTFNVNGEVSPNVSKGNKSNMHVKKKSFHKATSFHSTPSLFMNDLISKLLNLLYLFLIIIYHIVFISNIRLRIYNS